MRGRCSPGGSKSYYSKIIRSFAANDTDLQPEKKIRVCHLTSVHKALDTRIFWKECLPLSKLYKVFLIAPFEKSGDKFGVHIIALKPGRSRLRRFFITDWVLLFKAIGVNASIYHFHDPELIPAGLILKLLGKKVVYDIHENVAEDLEAKKWLPFKKIVAVTYRFLEKLAVSYFYLVLAEQSYSHIYQGKSKRFNVIQNFADLEKIHQLRLKKYNSHSTTFGLIGTLGARRGLSFILEALWILKQKCIIVNLKCIGEVSDDLKNTLANSAHYQDIKSQVEFTGYIPFPQSIEAISGCLAGLALPENLPNHRESYPTKLFEYMAAGLPVICSDFPLYKEIIDTCFCGIAVNPENPEAIAQAIEFLLNNPEKAESMSVSGMMGAEHFDWKDEEKKLLELYGSLIDK